MQGGLNDDKTNARLVSNVTINGYKVNEKLFMPKDQWNKLTEDQQNQFREKTKQYRTKNSLPSNQLTTNDGKEKENGKQGGLSKRQIRKLKQTKKKYEALMKATAENTTPHEAATIPTSYVFTDATSINVSQCNANVCAVIKRLVHNAKITNVRTVSYGQSFQNSPDQTHYKVTVDGVADTYLDGAGHIFLKYTERTANVHGFDNGLEIADLKIGTSVIAIDLPNGTSILLMKNESIDHSSQPNSMFAVNQARHNHIDVDDCPKVYKVKGRQGSQQMIVSFDCNQDEIIVPFDYENNLVTYDCRLPTEDELTNLEMYVVTSDEEWDPSSLNSSNIQHIATHPTKLLNLHGTHINDKHSKAHAIISTCIAKLVHLRNLQTEATLDPKYLIQNMMLPSELVTTKTLEATTQLGKHMTRYPQRAHLKSRYPQLNCRRQFDTIATDTVFASIPALEGETCFQLYHALTSLFTEVYGMLTESEGSTTLLMYIKERGALSTLHNDNSKMQTSKAWKDICNQHLIHTTTTEPYHPNQNACERCVQTIKSRVRAIIDTSGAPPSTWFYAVCYVIDLLNHTAHPQLHW